MTSVKLNGDYTIDEILEGLKSTDLPEPYKYQGKIGAPVLFVPASGANDIQVQLGKKKITLIDTPRPKDSVGAALKEGASRAVKESAMDALTGGLSTILRNNNPNKTLEKQVASELTRLFGS